MKHAREDYNRIQDPENLIPDDEPVFLLRAQDRFASATVRDYAARVLTANPQMAQVCLDHASKMDLWRPKKTPDLKGQ